MNRILITVKSDVILIYDKRGDSFIKSSQFSDRCPYQGKLDLDGTYLLLFSSTSSPSFWLSSKTIFSCDEDIYTITGDFLGIQFV